MHSRLASCQHASTSYASAGPGRPSRRVTGSTVRAIAAPPAPDAAPSRSGRRARTSSDSAPLPGRAASGASLQHGTRVALAPRVSDEPATQQPPPPPPRLDQRQQQQQQLLAGQGHEAAASWELKTGLGVTWLGTSSGAPTLVRNVSCTLVRMQDRLFLVDCGEGTYRQLRQTDIDVAQAAAIFVTHLHGDHCFGLGSVIPLITAARARLSDPADRQLHVYGPPGLAELLRAMLVLAGGERALAARLTITEFVTAEGDAHPPRAVDDRGLIHVGRLAPTPVALPATLAEQLAVQGMRDSEHYPSRRQQYVRSGGFVAQARLAWCVAGGGGVQVRAAQLQHRVPCWGYVFEEPAAAGPAAAADQQAAGSEGGSPPGGAAGRKVVILGDTMDSLAMVPLALGADLLSHEATFRRGMELTALRAQHSTAWMAGQFAAAVGARALALTHFSARYHGSFRQGGDPDQGGRSLRHHTVSSSRGSDEGDEGEEGDAADQVDRQQLAVAGLVSEAAEHYPGPIYAAADFWTFHVPPRQQLQQEQQEEQQV